jgi:aspartyl-tRNA(Asn)/glutamyl-tRNA(Gln) amidotransferase subunit A
MRPNRNDKRFLASYFEFVDCNFIKEPAEMLASLRSARVTSRQWVEIAVDQPRQCAIDLNAFAAISDKATASAVASDRRYRRGTARKLEGIPVAVKDIINTIW